MGVTNGEKKQIALNNILPNIEIWSSDKESEYISKGLECGNWVYTSDLLRLPAGLRLLALRLSQ